MSTSSSATASGRNQVPSDDPHLKTKICMFIVTRKDGTPFDVTSVTEEDIVEICITLGHTHPLDVLWYSAMGLVALFHTTEEMQRASHGAIKAMELRNELIAVRTMAPLEHHIRAYMTVVGGDHSKLQSPPQRGRVTLIHLGGGTLCHLQGELGDLADQELHQLMEDLHHEIALCKLHVPPSNPQPTPWGEPSGSSNLNRDDQEVTFPRGGGWVPQRQPSPSPVPA